MANISSRLIRRRPLLGLAPHHFLGKCKYHQSQYKANCQPGDYSSNCYQGIIEGEFQKIFALWCINCQKTIMIHNFPPAYSPSTMLVLIDYYFCILFQVYF